MAGNFSILFSGRALPDLFFRRTLFSRLTSLSENGLQWCTAKNSRSSWKNAEDFRFSPLSPWANGSNRCRLFSLLNLRCRGPNAGGLGS
jgi:hypothetical protein